MDLKYKLSSYNSFAGLCDYDGGFGIGFGMLISSMTTKYRDLNVLVGFAVNLLMYLSAVPYSLEEAQTKLPIYISPNGLL